MKNILLLIHDDAGQEARLRAALDVTRAIDGHLICLDVAVMRVLPGDGFGWDGGAMLLEEEYELESANRTRLEQRLGGEGVDWEWIDATGFLEQSLTDAADRADLIVVNCGLERCAGLAMRSLAADLAVKSGKPLLTVPANSTGLDVTGPALVAWDGSAPAKASLTEAIPLLRLAGSVTILEVGDGPVKLPAEEAGALLAHKASMHGSFARQRARLPTGCSLNAAAGHITISSWAGSAIPVSARRCSAESRGACWPKAPSLCFLLTGREAVGVSLEQVDGARGRKEIS